MTSVGEEMTRSFSSYSAVPTTETSSEAWRQSASSVQTSLYFRFERLSKNQIESGSATVVLRELDMF